MLEVKHFETHVSVDLKVVFFRNVSKYAKITFTQEITSWLNIRISGFLMNIMFSPVPRREVVKD